MEVSEKGNGFSFTWKVKKFSFLRYKESQFLKQTLNVKMNINTSWFLLLYPSTPKNCVTCVLRKESVEPLNFLIDCELCFLNQDGSPVDSRKVSSSDFNSKSGSVVLWLHHDDLLDNKIISLPEDALRICCKMWKADTPILRMKEYSAKTEIVETWALTWKIVEFSTLKPGEKRDKFVMSPCTGNPCVSFSLFLDQLSYCIFEISVLLPKLVEFCKCQVFFLGVSGKKMKCGGFEVVNINKKINPDFRFKVLKSTIMKTKEKYLLNDTLDFQCEAAFVSGTAEESILMLKNYDQDAHTLIIQNEVLSMSMPALKNNMEPLNNPNSENKNLVDNFEPDESNLPSSLKANANSNSENLKENNLDSTVSCMGTLQPLEFPPSTKEYYNSSLSWKDDLLVLYENGMFCDAELLVGSDHFPVHSLILSVRSSVLCDIFTRAKREGEKTTIKIEELDAGTVRKMIHFLYTDTVDDLDWECAKGLYFASNKYEILPLKGISSSFLKRNLSVINCCEILLLAHRYKDKDLMQAGQDFIADHDEVFDSDQWRSLEESHPRLAIETFRSIHQRHRKI